MAFAKNVAALLTGVDGQHIIAGMYGKAFASMYSGSMFGSSALTFAVWGYVLANQRPAKDAEHYVELNPLLLAPMFNSDVAQVTETIEKLCSPDPISRSPGEDGRRLVPLATVIPGPAQYRVVNGAKYRALRDEDERREYLRIAKRKSRQKTKVNKGQHASTMSTAVNQGQPSSTQVEGEGDLKEEVGNARVTPRNAEAVTEPANQPDLVWLNHQAAAKGWMGSIFASDRTKASGHRVIDLAKKTGSERNVDWRKAFSRVFEAWVTAKPQRINLPNWPSKLAEDWHQAVIHADGVS